MFRNPNLCAALGGELMVDEKYAFCTRCYVMGYRLNAPCVTSAAAPAESRPGQSGRQDQRVTLPSAL
jgi:hypothetical protein